jgi:uncharacterized protein YciI
MPLYAVRYDYKPDQEALAANRPAHRELLGELYEQGSLLASGPLGPEKLAALIIVKANYPDEALEVLDADPMWQRGLIERREVLEWTPVYGPFAG